MVFELQLGLLGEMSSVAMHSWVQLGGESEFPSQNGLPQIFDLLREKADQVTRVSNNWRATLTQAWPLCHKKLQFLSRFS